MSYLLSWFGKDVILARKRYMEFVGLCVDINKLPDIEFQNEPTEYRSQKTLLVRDISARSPGYPGYVPCALMPLREMTVQAIGVVIKM